MFRSTYIEETHEVFPAPKSIWQGSQIWQIHHPFFSLFVFSRKSIRGCRQAKGGGYLGTRAIAPYVVHGPRVLYFNWGRWACETQDGMESSPFQTKSPRRSLESDDKAWRRLKGEDAILRSSRRDTRPFFFFFSLSLKSTSFAPRIFHIQNARLSSFATERGLDSARTRNKALHRVSGVSQELAASIEDGDSDGL